MLQELRVRNFVLIDQLDLRLEPGFDVLTGETGAGKSILIGALDLVLGGRGGPDPVRTGAEEAEVEALFDLARCPRARALLSEAGLEDGDQAVLRRVMQPSGRTRAYLNGRLCTVGQLGALAAELVDISSQHESVALANQATHLGYLDAFARLTGERDKVAGGVSDLVGLSRRIDELTRIEKGRAEREAFLNFQLAAIREVDPRPGEVEELAAEKARLRHADQLGQITRKAAARLYDNDNAMCDELARLTGDLTRAAELDPELVPLAQGLQSVRAELIELSRSISRYAESIQTDPNRLAEVEDRLFTLTKLVRQYGADLTDVLAAKARLSEELGALATSPQQIDGLRSELDRKLRQVEADARALSEARKVAAAQLGNWIGRELAVLGMGQAKVVVEVAALSATGRGGEFDIGGVRLGADGMDRVEFLIAPNPGVEPRPLHRIASGGELSRALLALKRVLSDSGPAGLYVFDEVDAGVGGAVAARIGHAIADVARHRQVLCITHHAAIAAFADAHFVVEKQQRTKATTTRLRRVDAAERVDEVARMLAGANTTAAARRTAQELIEDAAKLAQGEPLR